MLNGTDEQQMYIHSLSNLKMLQSYTDGLGMVRYRITAHAKVILMTFPLGDGILCVSALPKANMNKIRDKVMKVLKSKSRSSASRGSTSSNNPARKKTGGNKARNSVRQR